MLDGLLIRVPWIDKILDGSKTWEIRGSQTTKRGRIGLIESGSGTVVGAVELVAVVGPLSLAELSPNWRKAGFDDERVSILPYRQTFAWVLRNPKRLKLIETNNGVTFREQAKWFLDHSMNRKRKPVKPATMTTWRNCVAKWLNPNLGDIPLASVNNAAAKALVSVMHQADLSPKTVSNYVGLVKLIVASATDGNGEQLFPRKWNHDFIDLPIIEHQYQPTFTVETMSSIVQKADGQEQALYALLEGTGLRVGEALGLEVRHLSSDCRTISVEQSCWEGEIQPPKTKNAYRRVDVCPTLAALLRAFLGERRSGLLFSNRSGKPLSQTNVARRSLHPILEELKVEKTGFHAAYHMAAKAEGARRHHQILAWARERISYGHVLEAGR